MTKIPDYPAFKGVPARLKTNFQYLVSHKVTELRAIPPSVVMMAYQRMLANPMAVVSDVITAYDTPDDQNLAMADLFVNISALCEYMTVFFALPVNELMKNLGEQEQPKTEQTVTDPEPAEQTGKQEAVKPADIGEQLQNALNSNPEQAAESLLKLAADLAKEVSTETTEQPVTAVVTPDQTEPQPENKTDETTEQTNVPERSADEFVR